MATGKRYYWIKLKESFMTSDTVDFMMSQPSGANYVVLYQMLCLKTINTDGRLSRTIGEIIIPYDIDKIVRDCKWFSTDTVRIALNLYKQFGLIYEDTDGTLVLSDHNNLIGTETDWSAKKRRQRSECLLTSGDNVPTDVPRNVPIDIRDKDIKRIENRDKRIDKEKEEPSVYQIPLNDNTTFGVTESYIIKLRELYPAADIDMEFRKIIGWCDGNPKKLKTRDGVKRFINGWMGRCQNNGGTKNAEPKRNSYGKLGTEV